MSTQKCIKKCYNYFYLAPNILKKTNSVSRNKKGSLCATLQRYYALYSTINSVTLSILSWWGFRKTPHHSTRDMPSLIVTLLVVYRERAKI